MRRLPKILLVILALAFSAFMLTIMAQTDVAEGQEPGAATYFEMVWQGDTFWVAQQDFQDTAIHPTGRQMLAMPVSQGPLPYLTTYPDIHITASP